MRNPRYESNKRRMDARRADFVKCPRVLKRGDVREDGMVFWTYHITAKDFESWITPETHAMRVKREVERYSSRLKSDPLYKLSHYTRCRVGAAFSRNGYSNESKTREVLGCSFGDFKNYLEAQFEDGMTWDNQGEWHLDHILPVSAAKTEEDILKLNHYTNFKPMWARENISKGDKFCPKQLNNFLSR